MKKVSTLRRLALAAAVTAAIGIGPTTIAQATLLNPTGYANGSQNFDVVFGPPATGVNVNAGGFTGVQTGLLFPSPSTIDFWCYELDQFFSFNPSPIYTDYVAQNVTPAAADLALAELFTEAGGPAGAASSTLFSAAFQLAVWEIKYDTSGTYDLFNGNFKVTSGANATTAQAVTWLAGLSSTTPTYSAILLHSPERQDFVTAVPGGRQRTPEPSPLPLLGAGLAAMMFAMRRRSNTQI